jgi:transposase InsO family protein
VSASATAADIHEISAALHLGKRGALKRADRDSWPFSTQTVSGGAKRLYTLDLLPAEVREAVLRNRALRATTRATPAFRAGELVGRRIEIAEQVSEAVRRRGAAQGTAAGAGLAGAARARMEAKLDLLARLSTFAKARAIGICAAMAEFCDAYATGELDVPAEVRELVDVGLHPATLRRWRRDLKERGAAALAGGYGNRAGSGALDADPDLREFAVGLLTAKPHIDGAAMHEALCARFREQPMPSVRTVQRWLTRWKAANREALLAVANPDAWKGQYKSAFGNLDDGVERINQVWQLDSTPGDIQLQYGRYNIVGAIDIATRRLKLHVSKTSSADAVCSLLRKAILEWGVPEAVKIDNGRDYASKRVQRALTALDVEARFSQPFSPWEKGNIERSFRTFSHGLLELLPGFSGHNVAEAQTLRDADSFADRMFKKGGVTELRMTSADLQAFCDRWCSELYEHRPHGGLQDRTPFEVAAALRTPVRRIEDVRALDMLLAEAPDNDGLRVVGKKGVKLGGHWYIAADLVGLIRQPVRVLFDEADAGRVVVYHDGAFVCVAECPELIGVSRKEIALEARARQNREIAEKRAELRSIKRRANTSEVVAEILAKKRDDAAALTAFPSPNVVHLTPAIEAARDAAAALDAEPPALDALGPTTAAHFIEVAELIRNERADDDDNRTRFGRALRAMAAPELELEQRWLMGYRDSSEFRGNWTVFESFGAEAFGLGTEFNRLLPADAPYHLEQGTL